MLNLFNYFDEALAVKSKGAFRHLYAAARGFNVNDIKRLAIFNAE
ncbi:MAG: hypothetical protein RLY86_2986, partial [Pseudomonadota bacterium]